MERIPEEMAFSKHVAGEAGVFTQNYLVSAMAAGLALQMFKDMAGSPAQLEGGFCGDGLYVGGASDAVRTENAFVVAHEKTEP
jgi:hypothetical protein